MCFWMDRKNKKQQKLKDWLTLFSYLRNFQVSLVDDGNFSWSFQRKRSLFFLKLSATEDSIENVSRNKLRCANCLAGRFTILEGALSARLLFSLVMAPINGATHPPLFLFLSSLSLRSSAGRIFFCIFSHSFFLAHSQGKKSFSVFSFSPLFSRENLFLYFLSLFFPCSLAREKNLFLHSLSLRSLAERIFFCKFSHSFFWLDSKENLFLFSLSLRSLAERILFCIFSHSFFLANSQGKIFFGSLCLSVYSQEISFSALFSHSFSWSL